MASRGRLSNAVRITDINDFLAPSQACVLPLGGGASGSTSNVPVQADKQARDAVEVARINVEPAGSVLAPIVPVQGKAVEVTRAKVTLSDCLTCSGCVTSAETVLLSTDSLDSIRQFMSSKQGDGPTRFSVAALSQQAAASIAVHFDRSLDVTARKLSTFLRHNVGFDCVLDLAFARHVSLLEASEEFKQRFKLGKKLTITSACPGWLSYAEKTQGDDILDCISSVRSPQGLLALIAASLRPKEDKREIWVTSVMPCHDKKLEANRPEFISRDASGNDVKEVDCVITAGELIDLMKELKFDFANAIESPFDEPFQTQKIWEFGTGVGSGSGGYADFILRDAAREFLKIALPEQSLLWQKASKSGDLKSIIVEDKTGAKRLHFATAYGFRSLQSILRKVRRGICAYDYIELMACPGGCNNGGGLLDPMLDPNDNTRTSRQQVNLHLQNVNAKFSEARSEKNPFSIAAVQDMYKYSVGGLPGTESAKKALTMSIQRRELSNNPASFDW